MWIAYLIVVLMVIGALSAGLALGLRLVRPHADRRRQILWSAGLATLLIMIVPFGGLISESGDLLQGGGRDFALAWLALLTGAAVIMLVICLPAAWFVSTRLDRGGSMDRLENAGDPELSSSTR